MSNSTYAALPVADHDRAADCVQVGLGQRQRFADPKAGAPQHDDQAAEPIPSASSPAARITAMISSTDGGSAGYARPCCAAAARGETLPWWLVSGDGQ